MNFLILEITMHLRNKRGGTYRKIIGCAFLGGLAQIALLVVGGYEVFLLFTYFILLPVFTWILFVPYGVREWCMDTGITLMIACLMGGITDMLVQNLGKKGFTILIGIVAASLVRVGLSFALRDVKKNSGICLVCLKKNTLSIQTKGLFDSGNRLFDPVSGQKIHIVNQDILEDLQIKMEDKERTISFQALGTTEGSVDIYRLDELCVEVKGRWMKEKEPLIGSAQRELFTQKPYDMIIHE